MMNNVFDVFEKLQTEEEATAFQHNLLQAGYSGFRSLLDGFTEALKTAMDAEIEELERTIGKARRLFPEPVLFSPSWERIWPELEATLAAKKGVLETVSASDRGGEWQVILDNPLAVQEVVCYPGLPFQEAAYLYAYFRPQLEKSEYIRLQKIQTLIQDTGA
ncbi:hypothetical protein [Paenibacillus sp. SI8]|uniref:hypothetical protein n=1 Tax=unclassified Paenibacillus TaxID=185978 RepID=UPI0034658E79